MLEAPFPVVAHDEGETSAAAVLDEMLADGRPIYIVGNTVAEFMREIETAIEERMLDEPAASDRVADASDGTDSSTGEPVDDRRPGSPAQD